MKTKMLDVINGLEIASPCKASWNAMAGDERARFCGMCEKHVYNIASLQAAEVEDLIRRTEGNFCARLYRRRDGTVLTADCPVGALAFSTGRLHRVMTYAVIGLWFLTTGAIVKSASRRGDSPSWPPTGPSVTLADWTDWALSTLGLQQAQRVMLGGKAISTTPPMVTMGVPAAPPLPLAATPALPAGMPPICEDR
jgi:hypothetical protein